MADRVEGGNPFDETEDVISATECTGILPALPMDDAPEAQERAARMYAIHAPGMNRKKRRRDDSSAK